MIEMVVILAMLVLIAGIILPNFPRLTDRIRLQRSTRELALSLRRAQNMALAVRGVSDPNTGQRVVPPAFGVYLSRDSNPTSYVIFADIFPPAVYPAPSNRRYDPGQDIALETLTLERSVAIADLLVDGLSCQPQQCELHIAFSVPEARLEIRTQGANPAGESAEIVLQNASGLMQRSVIVRTTGLIQVK